MRTNTSALKAGLLALMLGVVPLLHGCAAVVVGGMAGGALMAADRRTSGAYVEDQAIEAKIMSSILQRFGTQVHVNATSYNRKLLLTGEAPDANTRAEIEKMAAQTENVGKVYNEIAVGPNSALKYRNMDTWITTQIKSQMLDNPNVAPNQVKVVTEDAVVYLMGMVTQKEGQAAAQLASSVQNVRKVVTYFEYID